MYRENDLVLALSLERGNPNDVTLGDADVSLMRLTLKLKRGTTRIYIARELPLAF
jgi:hypothetical protein